MPVRSKIEFTRPTEERFRQIDYDMMAQAFSIHNDLGRLHDESIYNESLYLRAKDSGFDSDKELMIALNHKNFSKKFYVDLCISGGVIYELKAAKSITPAHEAQLLNYLFLTNLPFGKVINFSPESVEYRYVSTSLDLQTRSAFKINQDRWSPASYNCEYIPAHISSLLHDWGTHLDVHIYKEALIFLLDISPKPVSIVDRGRRVGRQPMALLSEDTLLHVTSFRGSLERYQTQIIRLLRHTNSRRAQWINFAGNQIDLISLHS